MQACPFCDHVLQDNDRFCRHCGAARQAEQSSPAVNVTLPSDNAQKADVSMAKFIGLIFLFMIPGVGLIAAIVLSFFAKQNETVVNFSRAALVIIILTAIIQYLLLQVLASVLTFVVNQIFSGVISQVALTDLTMSDIADIVRIIVN